MGYLEPLQICSIFVLISSKGGKVGVLKFFTMGKKGKKKKLYMATQCPCCFKITFRESPFKFKKFRRFDHHEEMFQKRLGVVCRCGYIVSDEGLIIRYDIEPFER